MISYVNDGFEIKVNDNEFKETAVKLVKTTGKSVPVIATELGMSDVTLYKWVKAFNKSILLGLARLNVFKLYPFGFTPFRKDGGA